jgi:membrane associated rhomboid family serine protease
MLENRDYMRPPSGRSAWSAMVALLILNVAAFIGQNVLLYFTEFPTYRWLALSTDGLRHGYVWQLLTFQFLHSNFWHLFFNCFALFMFGRELEAALGRRSFLILYFASGVLGGLVQALAGVMIGGRFALPVVGASAGVFGLVAAYASLFPDRELTMFLFFVIPVTMRAWILLWFEAAVTLLGIIFPKYGGDVAHAAHLGGMIAGMAFVKHALTWHWRWPQLRRHSGRQPPPRLRVHSRKVTAWNNPQGSIEEDLPAEEFLSREVDPILDKISAKGIGSLTDRERRILEAARQKMAKR